MCSVHEVTCHNGTYISNTKTYHNQQSTATSSTQTMNKV